MLSVVRIVLRSRCWYAPSPLRPSLPDVSGQKNSRRRTGQAGKPAAAEAHCPGGKPRGAAELIERDPEEERSDKAPAKSDTGIEAYGCAYVPRVGNGKDTRGKI